MKAHEARNLAERVSKNVSTDNYSRLFFDVLSVIKANAEQGIFAVLVQIEDHNTSFANRLYDDLTNEGYTVLRHNNYFTIIWD